MTGDNGENIEFGVFGEHIEQWWDTLTMINVRVLNNAEVLLKKRKQQNHAVWFLDGVGPSSLDASYPFLQGVNHTV